MFYSLTSLILFFFFLTQILIHYCLKFSANLCKHTNKPTGGKQQIHGGAKDVAMLKFTQKLFSDKQHCSQMTVIVPLACI